MEGGGQVNTGGNIDNASERKELTDGQGPKQPYRLSYEERQVLMECSRESFWYRCVPLGVVFVGTTQILVNRGVLGAHPRYGALFKNMGAALFAYVLGKMSYQEKCKEKILRLENSELADAMRRGKMQRFEQPLGDLESQTSEATDVQRQNVRTFESSKLQGLDERRRPSLDRDSTSQSQQRSQPEISGDTEVTYDELRRRHRIEHERKQAEADKRQTYAAFGPGQGQGDQGHPADKTSVPHRSPDNTSVRPPDDVARRPARRNKYGDEIEE